MIDSDQRKRLDNLSSAKRALLVETMRRKAALTQHSQTIPRRSQDDLVPLSYAQQRLWFLHQFQPDSPAYNVGIPLHFEGPLDLSALRRALSEVVRRHEVLRTTFPTAGGLPVQKIGPAIQVALPIVELSALAIDDRQAETRRLAMAEANGPFDLERGPLLRVLLLRLAPEIHDALFTVHHIISDEWSTMVFTREVTELYGSFLRHEPSPLAELALQYADFAVWQRRQLQGEVLVRLLTYWRRQLADLKTLDLPTDHPRPALQSFRGERRAFAVSESLTQSLRELSRQQGVTLFMTLLAVYQMMLHRLSGQDDVVVGSPVANRNRVEIEPLIGCFVNAMVLRTDFSGAQTFRTVLQRVRQVVLRASDHQDLPFEKLVEELQPERDPSRNPIFQVVIAFQNTQRESMRLPALSLSSMEFENLTAKFDLRLPLVESERGMVGALEHNTDLFDRTTAERWMRYFVRLLELVVSEVETSVSSLVLLSAGERHQLLWEWNDTLEPVGEVSIQDLVEAQVLR
ncbi:MAG TPA: condensation domain-containing protein, partial [Thermoanaerobaculia bacterium]|nr:condensation domain-containing protein [Thermoanaerobaculia bacterium]